MKIIFVRNPIAPDHREIKYVDAGPTIAEHIAPIVRDWPQTEFSVSLNGRIIFKEEWHTLVPADSDCLVLHPVLAHGLSNFFRTVLTIAIGAYLGGLYTGPSALVKSLVSAAGMYIGGRIANAILPPPKQPQQASSYGWNGPQPTAEPGTCVGKTYGTVAPAPVLIARFVTSDSTGQYLNLLCSGGEGPVDSIDNILIDGNPIGNYVNVQVDTRLGTNDQEPIPNFNDIVEDYETNYELDSGWVEQTTVGNADQGLQITLELPYGLAHVNSDGSLGNASVTIEAQYQIVVSGNWIEWSLSNNGVITDNKNTAVWAMYRIDNLTPGQYNVRVRCASKSGTSVSDLTRVFWITLSEITYNDLAYPNRVLVGIRALATNQLSSSDPRVTWEQTRSTVYVWNPYTNQYQTERALNPYWACYDLIHQCKYLKNINTGQYEYYVDGNPASRIDYDAFVAAAAYADGTVNGDYRFKLNIFLSDNISFWDALARLSIVGRGSIIPKGTQYSCICDRPGTSTQLFTVGNITAKSFKGQFESTKDRATSIEVTFYNKAENYSQDQANYYGPDYESSSMMAKPVQATYYGITDFPHAYAEAAYLSRCNQLLNRTENWEADIDAIACMVGDVVDVQHDIPHWGDAGGRIVSATATTVTLDKPVTLLANQSYAIKIRLYTDQIVEVSVMGYTEDTTTDTVTMMTPFQTVPEQYDVYAFGLLGKETKPFKITQIAKSGDQKAKITGVEYVEAVYDEYINVPVINYSTYNTTPVDVPNLAVSQQTYMQLDGTIVSCLNVSWSVPKDTFVAGYSVWYSADNGNNWTLWAAGILATGATILGVKSLTSYLVKVATVSDLGVVSSGVVSSPVYVTGKIIPPVTVQGFSCQEVNGGFQLSWQANTEPDIVGYNIFCGANMVSMSASALIAQTFMGTGLFVPVSTAGQYIFYIVAVDRSGLISETPAMVLGTFTLPADVTGFDVVRLGDTLSFMWQPVAGTNIMYELRFGVSWTVGQRIGRTPGVSYTYLFPTPGNYNFWIKAIDQYGNYSVNAQSASVVIVDSGNRNAVITIDQVANGWPGVKLNTYVNNGGLQLADGAVRGQYFAAVDLGKSFTARNTILANMTGVNDSGITWGDANFTWEDIEAQAPWEPDGDISGITLENQIALYTGIPANVIESLPLNGTTTGALGMTALELTDVIYANGRFMQGAFVGDLTRLSWNVNIPATFNTIFNVSVTQPLIDSVVFLTLKGSSGFLVAGFDPNTGVFYLQDQFGNRNEVSIQFMNTDWLSFGIVQNATIRKLFVSSFASGAVGDSEKAYGPVGSFTAAFLYPKLF